MVEERDRGFREIYATHVMVGDTECIRVYQAYNEQIAAAASAANSFAQPRDAGIWSETRMSWVKPSAAWMAYRCGWTLFKDKDQARVLAIDIDRARFDALLMEAVVTDGMHADQKGTLKNKPVVVQWDPERDLDPTLHASDDAGKQKASTEPYLKKLERVRSLQVGLRGRCSAMLVDPANVRRITDVTAQFHAAHAALAAGDLAAAKAALCPDERRMDVSAELRRALQMDVQGGLDRAPEKVAQDAVETVQSHSVAVDAARAAVTEAIVNASETVQSHGVALDAARAVETEAIVPISECV